MRLGDDQKVELHGLAFTDLVPGESYLGEIAAPGVYGDGLLTIPALDDANDLIDCLDWDFVKEFRVLAYNAFGDLFLRPTKRDAVFYLWTQWGRYRELARDARELFGSVLMDPSQRAKLLETEAFRVVSERLGPLPYGSVFTLNPIRALGGDGNLGRCELGRLDVYLSIISQSFEPE